MGYRVDNAVIMAAGLSSRFAPISYEKPKALVEVKGERLIERQIRQLQAAGIKEIIVVVGYKKEQLAYLAEKFQVRLVENPDYQTRNNNGSIYAAGEFLKNTYICSADNYYAENPFAAEEGDSYYSALYADGPTAEWCMQTDDAGFISRVEIGGENAWYMLGHAFWSEEFSARYLRILQNVYEQPETRGMLWEALFMKHLDELKMRVRPYPAGSIFEFDSLDELRLFDPKYRENSGSVILREIAQRLSCTEAALTEIVPLKDGQGEVTGVQMHTPRGVKSFRYENFPDAG